MKELTHLTDYLHHHALNSGTKTALISSGRSITWADLEIEVAICAEHLSAHLRKSNTQIVVGIILPNDWRFVVAYLAILKLGHIAMPIDPSYKELEVDAILDQIPPQLLVCTDSTSALASEHESLQIDFERLNAETVELATYKPIRLSANEQIASLLFTSGTTGKPKASPYTHANHLWNIKVCSDVWSWDSNDTLLISLRLSHWYGLVMGLSGSLYHGNTMHLHDWFDPIKTLDALSSGDISLFTHVPFAYQEMLQLKTDKKYNISNVRLMISGGAALPPHDWNDFKSRFGVEIVECYGSSETGRIASNLLNERIPGSPGRILPEVQAKLSSSGELLIKSPGVFPGYYNNPAATKASRLSDCWWKSGDLAEFVNGRVILKGRLQEKIRKLGYTISPRDIEWALLKHPKIAEVFVMGQQSLDSPSDKLIYIISGTISTEELTVYCKNNLLFAWRPDRVIMVDKLPRTTTGKPKIPAIRKIITD